MPDEQEEQAGVKNKGRIFLWFGAACLAASALLVPIRAHMVPLFSHPVPGTLICHTMLAIGLVWVAAGNIVLQTQPHRWMPVPFLLAYAFILGRDWLHILT